MGLAMLMESVQAFPSRSPGPGHTEGVSNTPADSHFTVSLIESPAHTYRACDRGRLRGPLHTSPPVGSPPEVPP